MSRALISGVLIIKSEVSLLLMTQFNGQSKNYVVGF